MRTLAKTWGRGSPQISQAAKNRCFVKGWLQACYKPHRMSATLVAEVWFRGFSGPSWGNFIPGPKAVSPRQRSRTRPRSAARKSYLGKSPSAHQRRSLKMWFGNFAFELVNNEELQIDATTIAVRVTYTGHMRANGSVNP